jgi:hypothetical protein
MPRECVIPNIRFLNFRTPSEYQVEAVTECDSFDAAKGVAMVSPGVEVDCANCPLTVEFDPEYQQPYTLFVEGLCGAVSS